MKLLSTEFKDLYIIEPHVNVDSRGKFIETFKKSWFLNNIGYPIDFCQDNRSISRSMVLRGLHYQIEPYSQSKLISVSYGKILDVVVDIRKDSITYGKYFSIELSSENNKILFIPRGFAHGYLTLSDNAILDYKVDRYYNKESERGISYNDSFLNIDWRLDNNKFIISEKDKSFQDFKW